LKLSFARKARNTIYEKMLLLLRQAYGKLTNDERTGRRQLYQHVDQNRQRTISFIEGTLGSGLADFDAATEEAYRRVAYLLRHTLSLLHRRII
jgi:DNA-binding IclR family transcriptional regulator